MADRAVARGAIEFVRARMPVRARTPVSGERAQELAPPYMHIPPAMPLRIDDELVDPRAVLELEDSPLRYVVTDRTFSDNTLHAFTSEASAKDFAASALESAPRSLLPPSLASKRQAFAAAKGYISFFEHEWYHGAEYRLEEPDLTEDNFRRFGTDKYIPTPWGEIPVGTVDANDKATSIVIRVPVDGYLRVWEHTRTGGGGDSVTFTTPANRTQGVEDLRKMNWNDRISSCQWSSFWGWVD